jgi:hypothetical protein
LPRLYVFLILAFSNSDNFWFWIFDLCVSSTSKVWFQINFKFI